MRTGVAVFLVFAASGATAYGYDEAVLLKGRRAAAALTDALGARMSRTLKDSGAGAAMSVCAYQAQALADEVSRNQGVTVRRTSLRLRNPRNAPDGYEKEVLARFSARAGEGSLPDETLDERTENGKKFYRYAKPLVAGALCTACHGKGEEIPEDVRKMLETRYPEDAATGYRPGDLLGIVSVVIPAQ